MGAFDGWRVVVLAAGRGTRMGGPKALMLVGGRPWWRFQQERLAASGLTAIWVVSAAVEAGMGDAAACAVRGDPDAPMFESVRAGVEAAPGDCGVLVLPVDVPAPTRATIASLIEATGEGAAIPVYQGRRGHPAALSRAWISRVLAPAILRGGALRLDELMALHTREVPVADPDVLVNLNTPADVDAWLHRPAGGPPRVQG